MVSKRKARKLGQWLNYLMGFTGYGPTALDEKPKRALGRKEKILLAAWRKDIEKEKERRRRCYREACIEVLGEDPDEDWKCEIE